MLGDAPRSSVNQVPGRSPRIGKRTAFNELFSLHRRNFKGETLH
jgi:hypothetical protein